MTAPLDRELRTVEHCAAIVAPVSATAAAVLLAHAAALRALGAADFAAPDNPGGPRETPAHQGGLPAPATHADAPVNPGPGAASDDAVRDTGKAADPAPEPQLQGGVNPTLERAPPAPAAAARRHADAARTDTPRPASRWTDERRALLRALWPTESTAGIVERLNALPGDRVDGALVRPYAVQVLRLPPRRARAVAEPSTAARELAEADAAPPAPADYALIRDWGRANGVDVSGRGRSGEVVARVNARRRELGLPAFTLVNRPLGALSEAELRLMRGAPAS